MLGAGRAQQSCGRASPNHTTHGAQTSLPSPANWPRGQLVGPLTRPSSNGTHLGGYLGPRPARSRLSPNEESGAAASIVDESGHLTCLRHTHGGPAPAQCSSSGAQGPDGSRAARRAQARYEPNPRTCDWHSLCESDGGVKPYGPRHNASTALLCSTPRAAAAACSSSASKCCRHGCFPPPTLCSHLLPPPSLRPRHEPPWCSRASTRCSCTASAWRRQ